MIFVGEAMKSPSHISIMLSHVLRKNTDVIATNNSLILQVPDHIVRVIRAIPSHEEGMYYLRWSVECLFVPKSDWVIWGPIGARMKKGYSESVPFPGNITSKKLCSELEAHTLPFLRSIPTMEAYYRYAINSARPVSLWPEIHFPLELAMGNFDAARMLMRWHRKRWLEYDKDRAGGQGASHDLIQNLCELLDVGNIPEIARTLRATEADSAGTLGMLHLWEPAQFPFETLAGSN